MMKSCATCLHLHRKCDGECGGCGHAVQDNNPSDSSSRLPLHKGGFEATLEQIMFGVIECKCMVCHDEDSGKYKYYEENKEITRLLNDDEDM